MPARSRYLRWMKDVLPALARPLVEPHLPAGLVVQWFTTADEACAMVADADYRLGRQQPARRMGAFGRSG